MNLNSHKFKRIHFTGIKGVAMASLAAWASEAGKIVTGSDVREEFPTDKVLNALKVKPVDFGAENITHFQPDLVIYTGAHGGRKNTEVQAAIKAGIPVFSHGQALGLAMEGFKQICIAGSHGKTTTSAMIATILTNNGFDPSYAIGCGEIFGLGLPGHYGHGEFFVAEADEYVTDPGHDMTPRFLWQNPDILVVTNVDYDHPDAYANLAQVQAAFLKLESQQIGKRITVINRDDQSSRPLLETRKNNFLTYGLSAGSDIQITHIGFGQGRTFVQIKEREMQATELSLKVAGTHNAFNAVAASCVGRSLGFSWEQIRNGLLEFGGTKRRFEYLGQYRGALIYDDYAHHPAEITATISAARAWFPKHRLLVVFQPHTYSRTKALLVDFARSLARCDLTLITDIYGSARETDNLGLTGYTLPTELTNLGAQSVYCPRPEDVQNYLEKYLKQDDLVIFMGAGDIYEWEKRLIVNLKTKN